MSSEGIFLEDKYAVAFGDNPLLIGWKTKKQLTPAPKGSALNFENMAESTLGSTRLNHLSTEDFCKMVKRRFKKKPVVYQKFLQILRDLKSHSFDHIETVKQLILLFEGHKDLILRINSFLPDEIYIEIQSDAAVIKVYEASGTIGAVDTGHGRTFAQPGSTSASNESLGYIFNVKETFSKKPDVYKKFIQIFGDYHHGQNLEFETIHKVVSLFKYHPELVLGFNEFLPPGYRIHMYEKSSYVIDMPDEDGKLKRMKLPIKSK